MSSVYLPWPFTRRGSSRRFTLPPSAVRTAIPGRVAPRARGLQQIRKDLQGAGRYSLLGMLMEVTCRCGWTTRGTKAQVVANVQAHGRSAHQTELTPAEVRAIWRVVPDSAADPGSTGSGAKN